MEDEYSTCTDTEEFLAKVLSKQERYKETIRKLKAENVKLRNMLALSEEQQNEDFQEIGRNEEPKSTPRRSDRIKHSPPIGALTKTSLRSGGEKTSPSHALLRSEARRAAQSLVKQLKSDTQDN